MNKIYAEQVTIHAERLSTEGQGLITLYGADVGEFTSEVGSEDILDSIEFSTIVDYVSRKLKESKAE